MSLNSDDEIFVFELKQNNNIQTFHTFTFDLNKNTPRSLSNKIFFITLSFFFNFCSKHLVVIKDTSSIKLNKY